MLSKERIALIATGDELTQGEIANLDGQLIAQSLNDHGISTGYHIVCTDDEDEILQAIQFQLLHAPVVIITGGLGPTTDDRTRYAVARACQRPLQLDPPTWQTILAYFQRIQLVPHESNRQQAMFPQAAVIFANPHGTAAGFKVSWENKTIYVLPGPPRECMPLYEQYVLPELLARGFTSAYACFRWRLFGIGESLIAPQLEALIDNPAIQTGYRVNDPYLDFKLRVPAEIDSSVLRAQIEQLIQPHRITEANEIASDLCVRYLEQTPQTVFIQDDVTKGGLAHRLLNPATAAHCHFVSVLPITLAPDDYHFLISGCERYWQGDPPGGNLDITLTVTTPHAQETQTFSFPFRHLRVMKYVIELLSHQIHQFLRQH